MENAQLYSSSNALQKRDTAIVLRQFLPLLDWSDEDVILDAGSGCGDVTRNLLLPNCPAFREIVGVDNSDEMVKFARQNHTHERLSFKQMDIENTMQPRQTFPEGFTKIFSFYCLHWIKDQRRALRNLYQLLNPGGSCLLVFLARNPIFNMYKRLAQNNRWAPYMHDLQKFIPVHQDSTSPAEDFRDTLESSGFTVLKCIDPEFTFVFENINYLRNALKAVNPFVLRMPAEMQDEFMDDCLQELHRMKTPLVDGKMAAKYDLLIALAQREN